LQQVQKQWKAEMAEMLDRAEKMRATLEEQRALTAASDRDHAESLAALREEIEGHDSAMVALREECDAAKAERHILSGQPAATREENGDLSQQLLEALADLRKLELQKDELTKRADTAEAEVSAVKAAQEAMALTHEEQLQLLKQQMDAGGPAGTPIKMLESTAFKTAINAKQAQLDQADATIRSLRAALATATERGGDDGGTTDEEVLQQVAEAKNAAEAAQEDAQLALHQEQQRHKRTHGELVAMQEENEDLSQQLQEALDDFQKMEHQKAELTKRADTAEAMGVENEQLRQRVVILGEALEEAQTNAEVAAQEAADQLASAEAKAEDAIDEAKLEAYTAVAAAQDLAAQQRKRDAAELAEVKNARESLFKQTEELRLQITELKSEMEVKIQVAAETLTKEMAHAEAARIEAVAQAQAAGKAEGNAEAEARINSVLQAEEAKVTKAVKDMETLALQLAAAEESVTVAQQAAKVANDLAASAKAEKSIADTAVLVAQEEAKASIERAAAAAQAEARASLEAERERVRATERELSAEQAARRSAEAFASEKAAIDRELSAARAEITRYKAHLEVAAAVAREESVARCAAEAKRQELEEVIELQTSQLAMAGQAAAAAADEAARRAKDAGDAALQLEQERTLAAQRSASEASATAAEGAVALKQIFGVLRQTQEQVEQLRHQLQEEQKVAHGAMQVRQSPATTETAVSVVCR
jgi:hypothetical protein